MTDPRRNLPSVDRLLAEPGIAALLTTTPRESVVTAVRQVLAHSRQARHGPPEDWVGAVTEALGGLRSRSLRPVINATGVVLHTNLGRAPLASVASEAMLAVAGGYSTLEFDLPSGTRGSRADHCRTLLGTLSGAEDALVVNNAAGALVVALAALARGGEVLISRGELIEIGGSFRIPEIIEQSGARLREVGTTNRTHLHDYERALAGAAAILTVHRSNFTQSGFVAAPDSADLAALAGRAGVPYLHDVGSGLLADLAPLGLRGEPLVPEAVAAGADLVIFSGDKLLGGPQAGCLVGRGEAITACRKSPLARALRADRFTLAALEATLGLYRDGVALTEVPVLRMLTYTGAELAARAAALAAGVPTRFHPELRPGSSAVGGGSFPEAVLPTTLVALAPGAPGANRLALRLRLSDPPVVARVEEERVLLDPRTMTDGEFAAVCRALAAIED